MPICACHSANFCYYEEPHLPLRPRTCGHHHSHRTPETTNNNAIQLTDTDIELKSIIPEDVNVAQLEEIYWANWKPNQKLTQHHHHQCCVTNEEEPFCSEHKQNTHFQNYKLLMDACNHLQSDEGKCRGDHQYFVEFISSKDRAVKNQEIQTMANLPLNTLKRSDSQQVPSKLVPAETNAVIGGDDVLLPLKHTDSFVLLTKQCHKDDAAEDDCDSYECPSAASLIALNEAVFAGSTVRAIKGGSYPLQMSRHFGRPCSPMAFAAHLHPKSCNR